MALTLENINLVKQRTRWDTRKPGVSEVLRALWKHMEALGNPDLQFVPLDYTGRADQVIANVPCKLYALDLKKPVASTVASWVKISDHATVSAIAADLVVPFVAAVGALKEVCLVFADGLPLAIGATTAAHTAIDGATDSAVADSAGGWAIIGAA
jgi:hypothetical protein